MVLRKAAVSGLVGILTFTAFVMPVSAHGHHGQSVQAAHDHLCEVCTQEDCSIRGWHLHDDSVYCGYAHEEGYCDGTCDTARVCTVDGCTQTGHHIHDGRQYCGYEHESGYCDGTCDSVTVCTVDGCTQTGRHTHDKVTYCGYGHESGYCDRSCETSRSAARGHGRHHGHH